MSPWRASALGGVVLILQACGAPSDEAQTSPAGQGSAPVATLEGGPPMRGAMAPAPTPSPLGEGAGLKGAVGGLSGAITGFQVRETASTFVVELASDVLFAFDSADLAPGADAQLRRTASLVAPGAQKIEVVGHTDSVGEADYNLALSLRRAQAVADWLAQEGGVPEARLAASGLGEADPAAPNQTASGADDPQGRALNRRVVVVIPKAAG
ncbi:OmpA family protein [Phenylobacterium sp.]|uniref:OmpA family protein n=1 Tax=Phenylobacterium sp. TaxID=1871053 RepID=UPI002731AE78|nr:OmpA family protein [Phenylobacterium sp.]MDP1616145.1 OmpA family protein [Phenylobacterium sp.]MDP1988727.1 OmpA family protein [Phenylobacterium sp.]